MSKKEVKTVSNYELKTSQIVPLTSTLMSNDGIKLYLAEIAREQELRPELSRLVLKAMLVEVPREEDAKE